MFLQMSHRELLEADSTRQTCHRMLGDTFLPVDSCWWCRRCDHCHATISAFLGLQCFETGIGLLQGCVHLVWCESVRFNLCHHEVFRHFEQGLGHGIFLGMGGWTEQPLLALQTVLWMIENCTLFPGGILP